MCDYLAFHTQLAAIIDVLAKSAVAEICQLVDDGYALLRLEVSQSQKQNEALRRRLRMMEQRVSRGLIQVERVGVQEDFVNNRTGVQILERSNKITEDCFLTEEGPLGKEANITPWSDGELAAGHEERSLEQPNVTSPVQPVEVELPKPKLSFIKEEKPEEDTSNVFPPGAVEWRAGSREKRPVQQTQNKAANHTEELTEQHRTRCGVWEVSGLEPALKAEGQSECVKTLRHRGAEHRAGGLNSLDSEFVMFERPGQMGSYCTQGGAVTETEDPCCSYSTDTAAQSLFHAELQSVSVAAEAIGTGNSLLLGAVEAKSGAALAESVSSQVEDETHTLWNQDSSCDGGFMPYGLYNLDAKTKMQPDTNSSLCSSYAQMHARQKLFICTFCGKGFNRPKKLEIHQRIHTGEKPFSCPLCGKRFAQSCNLNRHKIVHTGEKPFSCTQCGKRFTQSCHLKTHQRVHARGRLYSCTRFSEKRTLRIQQYRKHTGM